MNAKIKILCNILALALILGAIVFFGLRTVETKVENKTIFTPREVYFCEDFYSIIATVTEVDRERNRVFIVDARGEEWGFTSDLMWEVGDEMTVVFSTYNTIDIVDDIIISVNWVGEWEG